MGGIAWILSQSYVIGPIVLLGAGWLLKFLMNSDPQIRQENFFFGLELCLSGIGSLLGSIVNLSGTVDAARVWVLTFLMLGTIFVLGIVVLLHRIFEDHTVRGRARFCVLAGVCNLVPLITLMTTLYFAKLPVHPSGETIDEYSTQHR